jgi:hypothetical protein
MPCLNQKQQNTDLGNELSVNNNTFLQAPGPATKINTGFGNGSHPANSSFSKTPSHQT